MGVIPPGYKQTEAGLIPEDWEVAALGEIGECLIGLTYSPKNVKDHGTLVLRSSNIQEGSLAFDDNVYVDVAIPERIVVKDGDILVCVRNGSRRLIGKCALLDSRVAGQTFGAFMSVFRTPDYAFVFQQFQSDLIKRQIDENIGATINQITNANLNAFKIPLPSDPQERIVIAAALSDVDSLLAKLDQLIAKKRDLKQAAMQQLLTGQTRLPGFSGAWEVRKLGNILAEIGDGATPSTAKSQYFGGSIAWVVIDDIKDEIWFTRNTLTEEGLHACAAKLWPVGTLILSTGATIGEVGIAKVPLATKQGICGLVFDSGKAVPVFMKYWFTLNKPMILTKAQGSSIKEVRAPILSQLEVCLPSISEQSVIANALSDMDAELAALEARRDKVRELKQSMMQELLTGRIRLV